MVMGFHKKNDLETIFNVQKVFMQGTPKYIDVEDIK